MKTFAVSGLCLAIFSASLLLAQEPPKVTAPQKEHEWLQQFVGEWESDLEASAGPGQPAMKCQGTMKSRALGGFWVLSEMEMDMMGMPMKAVQTLGYDPQAKKYVGTWVDSMSNHMWKYTGAIDKGGKILTLEAEGPNFMLEGKLSMYRDVYEFKSKDHLVLTSSMQGDDGKWNTFMSGNILRKK